jgi:TM2 domain-containing membrane protein YozV
MATATKDNKVPLDVSQYEYWREGDTSEQNDNASDKGAMNLSYTALMVISLVGGFLGLDHLYLRSPMTFLAKLGVNLFFFGIWWLWDVCQIFCNEQVVRIYGLRVPGVGKQVGAGMLAEEQPDKKHARFFTYGVALLFGGLIGLDSFLLGQTNEGIFRLISTITFVFLPVSGLEWISKLYSFFFDTKTLLGQHSTYFGGPPGPSGVDKAGMFIMGILRFFALPFTIIYDLINNSIRNMLGQSVPELFKDTILEPISAPIQSVVGAYTKTLDVVEKTVESTKTVVDAVKTVVDAASEASSALPVTSLYSTSLPGLQGVTKGVTNGVTKGVTNGVIKEAPKESLGATMSGGGETALLPFTLFGTLLLVVASGLYNNFKPRSSKDDTPPKP